MSTRRNFWMLATILIAATFISCGAKGAGRDYTGRANNIEPPPSTASNENSNTTSQFAWPDQVKANNEFSWNLYKQIKGDEGNLFYSPYSISEALAMTYAGARGDTEKEMAKTLDFILPQEKLHPAFKQIDTEIKSRGKNAEGIEGTPFKLTVANSLWGQDGYQFLPEFLMTLGDNYGAGMNLVDYGTDPEGARVKINTWVEDKTEDKIKELIKQGIINELTRLVLVNAIYFNASWATQFQKEATSDGEFHKLDGSTTTVPMMNQQKPHGYYKGDGWQAVDMEYSGNELSMVVVVPDDGKFADIEDKMDATFMEDMYRNLSSSEVKLSFPKFTIEKGMLLSSVLKSLGMNQAFSMGADFSGMDGTKDLYINEVIHKAFVKVNEEGTEAAAATAVVMELKSMPMDVIELKVDRPFIFVIRDIPTGTTLFVGRVVDPK
jgi:serpin B